MAIENKPTTAAEKSRLWKWRIEPTIERIPVSALPSKKG
jgi:hypothetical protein